MLECDRFGAQIIKNSEIVERIIYCLLFWLSNYQDAPCKLENFLRYDFMDEQRKKSIKVPILNKERAVKTCDLLNKFRQNVPPNVFESIDTKFTAQEKFQREIICKMYQIN